MLIPYKLRNWALSDLENLVKYGNNQNIALNMSDAFPFPYTEEAGKKFIGFATSEGLGRIFCIDYEGIAIGGIGLHPMTDILSPSVEIGYWLAEPYWGKGIIPMVIPEVLAIAFQNPEIERVFGRTMGRNTASQRVLIKSGFELEYSLKGTIRKARKLEDEWVFGIRKETFLSRFTN